MDTTRRGFLASTAAASGAAMTQNLAQAADEHAHEDHLSSFAEGEAMPETYDGEGHVGTFADGEAMPETYAGEDNVGSFGDGAA